MVLPFAATALYIHIACNGLVLYSSILQYLYDILTEFREFLLSYSKNIIVRIILGLIICFLLVLKGLFEGRNLLQSNGSWQSNS